MKSKSRFLLALDRYDQSENVVRYFSSFVPPDRAEAVLFHVGLPVPDTFFDMESNFAERKLEIPISDWQTREKESAGAFLESAKDMLLKSGFSSSAVTVKHQLRSSGIARDILAESRKGYAALLVGRSETHDIYDSSLGNVTMKLISTCSHIPIGIVHGSGLVDNVLIGIDHSKGSWRCIEFMADAIANPALDITLCHVIRSLKVKKLRTDSKEGGEDLFPAEHLLKWQLSQKKGIQAVLDNGIQHLVNAGWPTYKVRSKVLLDVEKRSRCLVEEMQNDRQNTILVGRRGTSVVKEFFIGRVGQKVLNMVNGRTVWIVA